MKNVMSLAIVAMTALAAAPVTASTVTQRITGDHNPALQIGNEIAVAEGRAGNMAFNGDWEVGIGEPNTNQPGE